MNFTYPRFLELLRDTRDQRYSRSDAAYLLIDYFRDPSFARGIFAPGNQEEVRKYQTEMFAIIITKRCMRALIQVFEIEDPETFDRNVAAFVYCVATRATTEYHKRMSTLRSEETKIDHGNSNHLSRAELNRLNDQVDEMGERISTLVDISKKIVKHDAKKIARESGLDRGFVAAALCFAPKQYIEKYQIGYFMSVFCKGLYQYVFDTKMETADIRWKPMIREYIGDKFIYEAAISIILEGCGRIKNFMDKNTGAKDPYVKECWDSLTRWALKVLESSTSDEQKHMLSLYIKKLQKNLLNGQDDLRLDLLRLPEDQYPNLVEMIDEFRGKITDVMNMASDKKEQQEEQRSSLRDTFDLPEVDPNASADVKTDSVTGEKLVPMD